MSNKVWQRFFAIQYARRKAWNFAACGALVLAAAIALVALFAVLGFVVVRGAPALSLSFFTDLPKPVGEVGGGMGNALIGTVLLVSLGMAVGVPWGIFAGVYLSEYGSGKAGRIVRFSADLLSSVPSIVIGLFIYVVFVLPMKRFSLLAGGMALATIMLPTVSRTTEEILRTVPQHIREAGLALGLPRWKVTLFIVIRGAWSGILTGVMLAVARAAGETAPLLFTALNNRFWSLTWDQPIASVPVQIYTYAIAPYEDWHRLAWAGAFVLVFFVFALNLVTRFVFRQGGRAA